MKKLILASLFALVMTAFSVSAANPVKWTAVADMSGDEGTVEITASIDDGWYIYDTNKMEGVTQTKFGFSSLGITFNGDVSADHKPDKVLPDNMKGWTGTVTFKRSFTITDADKAELTVKVTYMACNGNSCTPAKTESITVNLK